MPLKTFVAANYNSYHAVLKFAKEKNILRFFYGTYSALSLELKGINISNV